MQKLTRRHVLVTLSGASVALCPAILNAHDGEEFSWGDGVNTSIPPVPDRILALETPTSPVDVTDLKPGDVAVVSRPTVLPEYGRMNQIQYVAVLRRTDAQIQAAKGNDQSDTIFDPRYLVVNLVCPHRGFAVGVTGRADRPFACTKEGDRHHSIFDASGFGVHGKSKGEYMSVPDYDLMIEASGDAVTKAVLTLA